MKATNIIILLLSSLVNSVVSSDGKFRYSTYVGENGNKKHTKFTQQLFFLPRTLVFFIHYISYVWLFIKIIIKVLS